MVVLRLTGTNNPSFGQKYEKYQNFLSEIFHFLVVNFSIYLNSCVFVMLVKFVVGRINGIFGGVETETRKFNY